MLKTPLFAALVLASGSCADVIVGDCRFEEPRQATLSAAGIREVVVDAAAGGLRIDGEDGASEIGIDGRACASRERYLDDIELSAERVGDRAVIRVSIEPERYNAQRQLHLAIAVPADLPISVDDTSGDTEIRNVAAVSLDDASGGILIEDVAGDVRIVDGSGDITLLAVAGEVRIDDGSGDVRIDGAGSVVVDDDGSGDLRISGVDGDVRILDDGSGDIDVAGIGGDLTVRDSGSGDVDYADIRGAVDLR